MKTWVTLHRPTFPPSLSPPQMPLQKLLFSATLTQNPEKLQQLVLHQPRLFSSIHSPSNRTPADPSQKQDRFDFPQGLTVRGWPLTFRKECRQTKWEVKSLDVNKVVLGHFVNDGQHFYILGVLCAVHNEQEAPPHPPLHPSFEALPHPLFHQLQRDCTQVTQHPWVSHCTIFYTSLLPIVKFYVDSYVYIFFRLFLLLRLFGGIQAAEFSSRLSPGERKKTLKDFEQGKIKL